MQIDLLGRMLSIRYPMDLAFEGDSKASACRSCCRCLQRKQDRSWQEQIKRTSLTGGG